MQNDIILGVRGLGRDFLGFRAVDSVDLDVRRGAIHALIGPNGAGKTTLFNLLTKFLQPSRGAISYNGRDITKMRPADVARLGLVRSFQISAVFGHMSVLENVRVALQRKRSENFDFWRSQDVLDALNDKAIALLESVNLADVKDKMAVELSYGRKRALEIATTLALDPELMLMDEPMAGVGHEEIQLIESLIRKVAVNRTILMVEHNLSVVASLSDTITVLARGNILSQGDYSTVSADPRVIEAYIGSGGGHAH
jgi:branched-chain amino acid transport system ATP-binding protein